MTRLFLRFYLGVVLILITAWLIQAYVFQQRSQAQNIRVVENALAGGARLARNRFIDADPTKFPEVVGKLQQEFEYPIQVFPLENDWLPDKPRQRLYNGEVVLLNQHIGIALLPDKRSRIENETTNAVDRSIADEMKDASRSPGREANDENDPVAVDSGQQDIAATNSVPSGDEQPKPTYGLLMGPLPQFVGPSQTAVTFGYGAVFLLAAIAIAILLRPVASQFRAVEQTAAAIAEGDLSARIETTGASNDLALVQAFNSMADRTESLLLSQRELLQAVSHELRTPLARIRFATDLVETAANDEERQMRLDAIDSATVKLDALVGELLTYVRLDSDAHHQTPAEPVELGLLLDQAIEIHAPLHPQVHFERVGQQAAMPINAHPTSLGRAIENLVSNAGRHAKSRVEVGGEITDQIATIHVDDDGEGIAEEDREKVLEPFVRLHNTDQRGSGLGLALVSRIIRQHNGEIRVHRSPLGGARFTLILPVHKSRNSSAKISRYRPETTSDAADHNLS